jgi:hypothetical protein
MQVHETIKRDVAEQSKGPRLQKLRAIELLLASLDRRDHNLAYCAIEFQGDVYFREATADGSDEYHEENKNYDITTSFTFTSVQVLNTLVIFVDCWISKACSPSVVFGFYAPNGCGKERASSRAKALAIEWPDRPVLELLQEGKLDDPALICAVKLLVLDEYAAQYQRRQRSDPESRQNADSSSGNLPAIGAWGDREWRGFLSQIRWKLGQEDHSALEDTIRQKIRQCSHYNQAVAGKEDHVIALMCDLLDKRQAISDPTMRFVHTSDLALIFMRVTTGSYKLPDPSWKTWERIPKPDDTRNLSDKVEAVSPAVSRTDLGRWSRKAANSLIMQDDLKDDPSVRAFKYQVYDACSDKLAELQQENAGRPLTSQQILEWIAALCACCEARIEDCSKTYAYSLTSRAIISDMIWELFDSCYLAFDSGAA